MTAVRAPASHSAKKSDVTYGEVASREHCFSDISSVEKDMSGTTSELKRSDRGGKFKVNSTRLSFSEWMGAVIEWGSPELHLGSGDARDNIC